MSDHRTINVLLSSFPGLGLPNTLSLPLKATTSVAQLTSLIRSRIPSIESRLILTTPRNKQLLPSSHETLASLLPDSETLLPLRLSAPLCGGKGGFGSQLRAAGGRMSSKRKKNAGDPNASSRNLDGRRLRTVTEAKALAEYLATKTDMDRKQKEKRRQRWEQVVEAAERREAEIKNGSKGRVDGQWVEDKEEAGERTREAVKAVMASGQYKDTTFTRENDEGTDDEDSSDSNDDRQNPGSAPTSPEVEAAGAGKGSARKAAPKFFGWDEDDEFMSSEEDDQEEDASDEGMAGASATATATAT